MKTFQNLMSEVQIRAQRVLAMQTAGKKPNKKVFKYVLKNVRKNPDIAFSVFTLMALFEHAPSFEREQEIFNLLAFKMSECNREKHYHLIEYMLLRCYHPLALAICYSLRYKWGFVSESEYQAVRRQIRVLDDYGVGHYFRISVRTIAQKRKSKMLEKAS